jgi:hypothetical protein
MSAVDDETSFRVNAEIHIMRSVGISRYFVAAALVLLMYDTILTMEDEVSGL